MLGMDCWDAMTDVLIVQTANKFFPQKQVRCLNEIAAKIQMVIVSLTALFFCFFKQQFKKNLKGVNGNKDFDQDMLEDIYNAIK